MEGALMAGSQLCLAYNEAAPPRMQQAGVSAAGPRPVCQVMQCRSPGAGTCRRSCSSSAPRASARPRDSAACPSVAAAWDRSRSTVSLSAFASSCPACATSSAFCGPGSQRLHRLFSLHEKNTPMWNRTLQFKSTTPSPSTALTPHQKTLTQCPSSAPARAPGNTPAMTLLSPGRLFSGHQYRLPHHTLATALFQDASSEQQMCRTVNGDTAPAAPRQKERHHCCCGCGAELQPPPRLPQHPAARPSVAIVPPECTISTS